MADLYHLRSTSQSPQEKKQLEPLNGPVDSAVNPHHPYCLVHRASRSTLRAGNGSAYYNVHLQVDIYANELDERKKHLRAVESVVYQVHESFPMPVFVQQNWQESFRLDLRIWGEFWIRATIIFKDRAREAIQLLRYLNLFEIEDIEDE